MYGTPSPSSALSTGATARARSGAGSHTTTAKSTTVIAAAASKPNSPEPGQSTIDQGSPRKLQSPSRSVVVMLRLRGPPPPRLTAAPAAPIRPSNRVDLPLLYGPTRATERGRLASADDGVADMT